uniref:Uncharacterized protein n=1 Tax=Cucumis melo TaxID=3656 RepID=A0A9I9E8F6_CUCME
MKEEVQFESSIGQNPSDFDPLLENQNDSSSHGTSDEIDTEASSIPSCRICLESDAESDMHNRRFARISELFVYEKFNRVSAEKIHYETTDQRYGRDRWKVIMEGI